MIYKFAQVDLLLGTSKSIPVDEHPFVATHCSVEKPSNALTLEIKSFVVDIFQWIESSLKVSMNEHS